MDRLSGNSQEKIIAMEVWQLSLPVTSRRDHGIGSVEASIDVVIVRLQSESGVEGFGEASPWVIFTGSAEASYFALDRYMRPHVVGARVSELPTIMEKAEQAVVHCSEAKAALETALLDLQGRITGVPIWQLLGGRCRQTIPLSVSIADPDFDKDITLLERIRDDGIGIIKLKAGFKSHAFDAMRLERIRRDFPEFEIRVDYNQGLSPAEAMVNIPDIAGFSPTFIEQPIAARHYDHMARLRDISPVPLLADESVFDIADMVRAVGEGICDGVSIKIMKSGGLRNAQTISRIAGAAGLLAYGGDMFETGLAHLAGTHMIAASPDITLGCEFYQAKYFLGEDLLTQPFPIEDGQVKVPDGPGLGMEIDREKINKYCVRKSSVTGQVD